MASSTFDIIVIGCGVMGLSTCLALAKRGVKVLGIDKYGVPNTMGSSHGQTRMTRSAYFEHQNYVPLIRRANELWREIERESGQNLLHLTGAIYIGPKDGELIAGSKRAADQHGLEYRLLSRACLANEYPQFNVEENLVGLWERDAGYLLAEPALNAIAETALKAGAEIHGAEDVITWTSTPDSVTVTTDRAVYNGSHLVFCGGPWSTQLVKNLGVDLKITRQVMGWVWPKSPERFTPDRFLPFAVDDNHCSLHYGFPLLPGAVGLKVASHALGIETTPQNVVRQTSLSDEQSFRPFIETILPEAAGPTLEMRVCIYTNSPDSHFILDRLPSHDNVTIGCGFSGHGFKFAPIIGEVLADLATHGKSELPTGFLGLNRFDA